MPTTGRGVDLHPYYQRGTNALPDVSFGWIKEADGASVYRKVADGRTWTADAHAALFRRLGIPSGGYIFAHPSVHGAAAFDVLWGECLRLRTTGVAPACDIEGEGWNATNANTRGREYCQRARARGVRPAIYMDLWLLQACRPDRWPEQPVIWAPRYSNLKPEDGGRYVGHYDVHQYTSSGSLPGSAGLVDWSQAYTSAFLNPTEDDDMPDKNEFESWTKEAVGQQLFEQRVEGSNIFDFLRRAEWERAAQAAKLDALAGAVANLAANPDITPEAMQQMLTTAVAQSIKVSGELHVTPANAPAVAQ